MRLALIYTLLLATLLPLVSPWGTIAYYHANKDYIARVLCVNRNRPDLHCDGKCYLAKKLKAQQDKQDKETTERVQHIPLLQLFCNTYPVFSFTALPDGSAVNRCYAYRLAVYTAPRSSVFHPPLRTAVAVSC